jgi:hypothetical protein
MIIKAIIMKVIVSMVNASRHCMIKWKSFDEDQLQESNSDQKKYFLGLDTTCCGFLHETEESNS